MTRLSDDEDSMMAESSSSPSTPTHTGGGPALRTSTSDLQHLDLQSPPQSQESTPHLERTQASVYANILGDPEEGGAGKGKGTGLGGMVKDKSDGVPAWMTKRGMEEASIQMEKLVDAGFSSRNMADIFDEKDMKLPKA